MKGTAKVYANRSTKRVHSAKKNDRCRRGEIKAGNSLSFASLEQAVGSGFIPCKHCFPQTKE